jgi:hypothetical protein
MMPIRWMVGAAGLVVLVAIARGDLAAQSASVPTMTLLVDETQASRRLTFVHEDIRVQQGPLRLRYRSVNAVSPGQPRRFGIALF